LPRCCTYKQLCLRHSTRFMRQTLCQKINSLAARAAAQPIAAA
jgi:hypothetical protein